LVSPVEMTDDLRFKGGISPYPHSGVVQNASGRGEKMPLPLQPFPKVLRVHYSRFRIQSAPKTHDSSLQIREIDPVFEEEVK